MDGGRAFWMTFRFGKWSHDFVADNISKVSKMENSCD
jgi:hypothetical protein